MSDQQDIVIRDARDRLIDLLSFGETYPLRDLAILDDQLTVPFNRSAKIPIEKSQSGVRYQLFDRNDVPVQSSPDNKPIEAQGTGGLLMIESPKILNDITYQILAQKNSSGHQAYLHETATIRVGLDVELAAFIDTLFLEPTLDNPNEEDARIVDYGAAVTVTLKKSQEGVDYRLVSVNGKTESILSEHDVRGTHNDIVFSTRVFNEDTDIRIRATKTFDASEKRKTQTTLLDIVLPLKVRANTGLQVAIDPTPIIDYKASTALKIEASQQSVRYQVFSRKISDADFIFDAGDDGPTRVSVKRNDVDIVQVSIPPQQHLWRLPEGFTALGEPKSGTGGTLSFPVEVLSVDTMLIVRAEKNHQGQSLVSSAMPLAQAAVVLLRPDPDSALELRVTVTITDTKRVDIVEVLGGQSGVFYHLRKKTSGPDLTRPAYFHQKDEIDPAQNKGIGQLRIESDFVVPRSMSENINETDPALIFPASAILDGADMILGTRLRIPGIKALTKIPLKKPLLADLPKLPGMAFDASTVDVGDTARLVITQSLIGERYQFLLNGIEVKRAKKGNGNNLVFITDTVTEDSVFEVWVTQPDNPNLKVTRIVPLEVKVTVNE